MLLLLLFFTSSSYSQSTIEIIRDPRVDTLVSRYAAVHRRKASIDGFRIQIAAGSNRTNIYKVKSEFNRAFPKIKQYLIYQAPNFKLRVGNYRTRLEAYKDLQEILPVFNGAFIIRDEIKILEL
ncbi:MAG TPA: SPOR domain-containing protein [Chitinophagales bacterium]|nr:SPOR domain-containing protein [Chitinophagales bacterium]